MIFLFNSSLFPKWLPPIPVGKIPIDRLRQTALEIDLRSPSQLIGQLFAAHGVPQIVSRTVGNKGDQLLALAQSPQNPTDQIQIGQLVSAAHIVNLTRFTALQYSIHRRAVILRVHPTAIINGINFSGN